MKLFEASGERVVVLAERILGVQVEVAADAARLVDHFVADLDGRAPAVEAQLHAVVAAAEDVNRAAGLGDLVNPATRRATIVVVIVVRRAIVAHQNFSKSSSLICSPLTSMIIFSFSS